MVFRVSGLGFRVSGLRVHLDPERIRQVGFWRLRGVEELWNRLWHPPITSPEVELLLIHSILSPHA